MALVREGRVCHLRSARHLLHDYEDAPWRGPSVRDRLIVLVVMAVFPWPSPRDCARRARGCKRRGPSRPLRAARTDALPTAKGRCRRLLPVCSLFGPLSASGDGSFLLWTTGARLRDHACFPAALASAQPPTAPRRSREHRCGAWGQAKARRERGIAEGVPCKVIEGDARRDLGRPAGEARDAGDGPAPTGGQLRSSAAVPGARAPVDRCASGRRGGLA